MDRRRVPRQQTVGQIIGLVLQIQGGFLVLQSERHHHLAFPHGNRGADGGVDLVGDGLVRLLDQLDLRRLLQADHADAVQIVKPLVETLQLVTEVLELLRGHRIGRFAHLPFQLRQISRPEFLQRLASRGHRHAQIPILLRVLLIHAVIHGDVADHL